MAMEQPQTLPEEASPPAEPPVTEAGQRAALEFPAELAFLFKPMRYKVARGGRGSIKSWTFARALLVLGASRTLRILCARELQVSIAESVHKLLSDQVVALGLEHLYDVQKTTIINRRNKTEFTFIGIKNNVLKVKSMEGYDICWVEEAEKVSGDSWNVLIPTIRKAGSEIWVSYNPDLETDPTDKMFVRNTPPDAYVVTVNWRNNRWLSEELRRAKDYMERVDPDAYDHVWEGGYRKNSAATIFRGKCVIEAFEPEPNWDGPYYGADWGFANDPTTMVRCWIDPVKRRLLVEYEAWGIGIDIDKTPQFFTDAVPGCKGATVRADCARPETISYVRRHGFDGIEGAPKWDGSIEDGIAFLRSFEQIVIHPRCVYMAEEARLYSYKVDRLTSAVLTDIVDKHNHCWDALRYALAPLIRAGKATGWIEYMLALGESQKGERASLADGRAKVSESGQNEPAQQPVPSGEPSMVEVYQQTLKRLQSGSVQ